MTGSITIKVGEIAFPPVEFNVVQIVRCIKRARQRKFDEDGKPIPFNAITEADIAQYLAGPVISTGESYKQQMAREDSAIRLREIETAPDDTAGAIARADAIIANLNDPAK
jgi:hypothetical protein